MVAAMLHNINSCSVRPPDSMESPTGLERTSWPAVNCVVALWSGYVPLGRVLSVPLLQGYQDGNPGAF